MNPSPPNIPAPSFFENATETSVPRAAHRYDPEPGGVGCYRLMTMRSTSGSSPEVKHSRPAAPLASPPNEVPSRVQQ